MTYRNKHSIGKSEFVLRYTCMVDSVVQATHISSHQVYVDHLGSLLAKMIRLDKVFHTNSFLCRNSNIKVVSLNVVLHGRHGNHKLVEHYQYQTITFMAIEWALLGTLSSI